MWERGTEETLQGCASRQRHTPRCLPAGRARLHSARHAPKDEQQGPHGREYQEAHESKEHGHGRIVVFSQQLPTVTEVRWCAVVCAVVCACVCGGGGWVGGEGGGWGGLGRHVGQTPPAHTVTDCMMQPSTDGAGRGAAGPGVSERRAQRFAAATDAKRVVPCHTRPYPRPPQQRPSKAAGWHSTPPQQPHAGCWQAPDGHGVGAIDDGGQQAQQVAGHALPP